MKNRVMYSLHHYTYAMYMFTEEQHCVIEGFRVLFNITCELAIVIANVMAFGTFVIILICVLIFFKVRLVFVLNQLLTLILSEPKVISLCHQYRARSACTSLQSDQLYTVG